MILYWTFKLQLNPKPLTPISGFFIPFNKSFINTYGYVTASFIMQHIEYVCINQNYYDARITVQRLTKGTLQKKTIEGITVSCQEYLDENGLRFYDFLYEQGSLVGNPNFTKHFDCGITRCHLKVLEDKDRSWHVLFGFHKDDLNIPGPLRYCPNNYGTYDIQGPTGPFRKDYWGSIIRDSNGVLVPE